MMAIRVGGDIDETRLVLSQSLLKLGWWVHGGSSCYSLNFFRCLEIYKIKKFRGYFTGKNLILYKIFQSLGKGSHLFILPYHDPRAKWFFKLQSKSHYAPDISITAPWRLSQVWRVMTKFSVKLPFVISLSFLCVQRGHHCTLKGHILDVEKMFAEWINKHS